MKLLPQETRELLEKMDAYASYISRFDYALMQTDSAYEQWRFYQAKAKESRDAIKRLLDISNEDEDTYGLY
jgi:hypothetical protein